MELLKRNEFGIVHDDRAESIKVDVEKMFEELCNKYNDVAPVEIAGVINDIVGYYASRRTSKLKAKLKKGE